MTATTTVTRWEVFPLPDGELLPLLFDRLLTVKVCRALPADTRGPHLGDMIVQWTVPPYALWLRKYRAYRQ